jgi:hypothetical protein
MAFLKYNMSEHAVILFAYTVDQYKLFIEFISHLLWFF